ncbi:MAG: hypothetical protein HKL95_03685 [Phycisphaerae bacterium]|nr:hypothetical protein [Phycisphaerae bacterium]
MPRRIAHTAEGSAELRTGLAPLGKAGLAIETNCGPAVERLLDMGLPAELRVVGERVQKAENDLKNAAGGRRASGT